MSRFMSSGLVTQPSQPTFRAAGICILTAIDLRDPSTVPLNFTKSINLALSERGITAIRDAGDPKLLDSILETTIPMRGRMIHGRGSDGSLYEDAQDYDVHGKVCPRVTQSCQLPRG